MGETIISKGHFEIIWTLVLHICIKFNVQIGAGRHLKGFGLASLSGARRGYMPPWLKTNYELTIQLVKLVKLI